MSKKAGVTGFCLALLLFCRGEISTDASSEGGGFVTSGAPVALSDFTVTNGAAGCTIGFTVNGGTSFLAYDIMRTTDPAQPIGNWDWLGIAYTSNRYVFAGQPLERAFYALARPSQTTVVSWGRNDFNQSDPPSGLTNAVQICGGRAFSLALRNNGGVTGWGQDPAATVPEGLAGVKAIAAGWQHALALLSDGTIRAWGTETTNASWNITEVPAGLSGVTSISAGGCHSLALRNEGTVAAWGSNQAGESSVPTDLSGVVGIAAGGLHSLALKSDGTVVAWGDNTYGQQNVPVGLSAVAAVAAGWTHSVALKANGTVVCWGSNGHGESMVPAGLSNVVAVAAGGYPGDSAYTMALRSDGAIVVWGFGDVVGIVRGLGNVIAMGGGTHHGLVVRTGPATPVLTLSPADQCRVAGSTVTFTGRAQDGRGVTYQWLLNDSPLEGETNATLTLTNVQAAQAGGYCVAVFSGTNRVMSPDAVLDVISPPVILSPGLLNGQFVPYLSNAVLSVAAFGVAQTNGFPLSYQWMRNGTNLPGQTSTSYAISSATTSDNYAVKVSNAAGTRTSLWQVAVARLGGAVSWGANGRGLLNCPPLVTNIVGISAGKAHAVAVLESGTVTNWGAYCGDSGFSPAGVPPSGLSNVVAVAAGARHDLALDSAGRITAWGADDFGQTDIPGGLTNAMAISAGGQQCLALKRDRTVVQWGQAFAPVPDALTSVTAIASGTNFHLALQAGGSILAWGANDQGQSTVPQNATGMVAIAAGGAHALALKSDGTLVAWGSVSDVPLGLSNVMRIACGESHNLALRNDGTVVTWGDNSGGQSSPMVGLNQVKLLAGGGDFSVAVQYSPSVQYLVDVSSDLLLIYNTNCGDSAIVKDYYLAHRPLVADANVLGIGCAINELIDALTFTNQILAPYRAWQSANPTRHPLYVILFPAIPTRVWEKLNGAYTCPMMSTAVGIAGNTAGIAPVVTSINMGMWDLTNDCIAYINKLESIGTNYSPGSVILSAGAGGYANTNFVLDDLRHGAGYNPAINDGNYSGSGSVIWSATNGLRSAGVPPAAIRFYDGIETITNGVALNLPHPTGLTNVAGYMCWGAHSSLANEYARNGAVKWQGNSGWWIIETIESGNGARCPGVGNFTQWFSDIAFGSTNHENTPVGAVSHTDEPHVSGVNNASLYFGSWAAGKTFGMSAWMSRRTDFFQAVGDPLVRK